MTDYLTEAQAAEALQVPARDVRRFIRSGRLRGVRLSVTFIHASGQRRCRIEYRIRREWLDELGESPAPGARPWPRLRAKG
jgi:predicted site-specific integrase-resolvase